MCIRDRSRVVRLLDHFEHSGPNGRHVCMVFEMLGANLLSVIRKSDYRGLPIDAVRNVTKQICMGLDFLHRRCSIIHTDLKPENVLLKAPRQPKASSLSRAADAASASASEGAASGLRRGHAGDASAPAGGAGLELSLEEKIEEITDALASADVSAEERKKLKKKLKKHRQKQRKKPGPANATASDDAPTRGAPPCHPPQKLRGVARGGSLSLIHI